jgi:membrane fusion protein (multidrug efflux system)
MLKRISVFLGYPPLKLRSGIILLSLICLLVVSGAVMLHFFSSEPATAQQKMPPVPVKATPVQVINLAVTATAVGTLQSHQSVTIRPEITGRIARIHFKEGQAVKAGAVLISLDDETTKAALNQAAAELNLADRNYKRAVDLFSKNAGTGRARDETLSQLDVAKARLELARANFNKTQLKAPFGGLVGLRKVDEGAYVEPGQDLVNLENINPVKVDFRLPETLLPQLKAGQKVKISVEAYPGREFEGSILALDPRIDAAGRSVAMRALIPNSSGLLRPGLFARVSLKIAEHKNALMAPEESIVAEGEKFYVFKAVGGRAVKVQVTLGQHREGAVEILSGLSSAGMVITAGQEKLGDGSAVVIQNDKARSGGGI